MYDATQQAQSECLQDINTNNDWNKTLKIARAIKGINKDVTREKCVHDDNGNVTGGSNAGEAPY